MSDLRDTALASLICERNDHPDAPACDGCYAMAAHLRENGYRLAPSPTPAPLDVERLVAAIHNWHNPSAAEFGSVCRAGGHCRRDAEAIAREYAALPIPNPCDSTCRDDCCREHPHWSHWHNADPSPTPAPLDVTCDYGLSCDLNTGHDGPHWYNEAPSGPAALLRDWIAALPESTYEETAYGSTISRAAALRAALATPDPKEADRE